MTYLISPEYIKRNTFLNDSVDEELIYPAIKISQETALRSILNPCLYDKIIELVEDEAGTDVTSIVGGLYNTLLTDYIAPYLTWQTCVELYPFLSVKIDNSTLNKHSKETANPASKSEVDNIIEKARYNALAYQDKMEIWLCETDNRIDEYFNCTRCKTNVKSAAIPRIEF